MNFCSFLEKEFLICRIRKLKSRLLSMTNAFDDRIEDGMSEQEAVANLGEIERIAENIVTGISIPSLVKEKIKTSHEKSRNKTLWFVLAICGFPVWVPLVIAFSAVILAVYVVIWSAIVTLYATLAALAVSGIGGIISGAVCCINADSATGIAVIGMSIASIGLFVMSFKPVLWITKKLIELTERFIKKIKSLFISRKEAV